MTGKKSTPHNKQSPEWLTSLIASHEKIEQWGIQPKNIQKVARNAEQISDKLTMLAVLFHPDNPNGLSTLYNAVSNDDDALSKSIAEHLPANTEEQLAAYAQKLHTLAKIYHENAQLLHQFASLDTDKKALKDKAHYWAGELKTNSADFTQSHKLVRNLMDAYQTGLYAHYEGTTPWEQQEKKQEDKELTKRLTESPITEDELRAQLKRSMHKTRQKSYNKFDEQLLTADIICTDLSKQLKPARAAKEIPLMIEQNLAQAERSITR